MKKISSRRIELVDGIWPDTGTYIQCSIPIEWLNENAFDDDDYCCLVAPLDLVDLIERRLKAGACELSRPTREVAQRTISALIRYADYLDREFVHGPRAESLKDARKLLRKQQLRAKA